LLKAFGVKLGPRARRFTFAERVRQAVAHDLLLTEVSETLLRAWSTLIIEHNRLDALLLHAVGEDELCLRFMAMPGVGPVTAATFKAAVDEPRRFRKSRTVASLSSLPEARTGRGPAQMIDLCDYLADAPLCAGRPLKHDLAGWRAVDDWPEQVPVNPEEIVVFERWLGDIIDELFGPC